MVVILLFMRALLDQNSVRKRPRALLEMTRLVKSVPAGALLN